MKKLLKAFVVLCALYGAIVFIYWQINPRIDMLVDRHLPEDAVLYDVTFMDDWTGHYYMFKCKINQTEFDAFVSGIGAAKKDAGYVLERDGFQGSIQYIDGVLEFMYAQSGQ